MPALPHPFARLDGLERRYDGPIPPEDPALAGRPTRGGALMLERLAREQVALVGRRRRRVVAGDVPADPRLGGLTRDLAAYREMALTLCP